MIEYLSRMIRITVGPAAYDEVGIAFRFLGRSASTGWVIDVGAHVGDTSRPFAERGWNVLAIEPDPVHRSTLESTAAQFPSLGLDFRAISLEDGALLTLYRSHVSAGISTLSAFHPSHEPGPVVTTVRLDTLIAERAIADVSLLKTDTEGFDLFALQSFPWDTIHPTIVVSEFENHKTRRLGYTLDTMAQYLQNQGYVVFVSEWYPIVEYGVVHTWKAMRRYPTADIDEDGWGNLIAVDPDHAATISASLA